MAVLSKKKSNKFAVSLVSVLSIFSLLSCNKPLPDDVLGIDISGAEKVDIDDYEDIYFFRARNEMSNLNLENIVTIDDNSTWSISKDINFKTTLEKDNITLSEGHTAANLFYIKVIGNNHGTSIIYPLLIHRNYIFTVSFDTDGGSAVADKKIEEGFLLNKDEITDPTKAGYTFKGWDYDFNKPINANTVIHSVWDANKYTLSLSNDGKVTTKEVTYGEEFILDSLSKVGSEFLGWEDNSGILYHPGSYKYIYTNDLLLTAKWNTDKYTLSLSNNGQVTTKEVFYGEEFTLAALTKVGFTFVGWEDNSGILYHPGSYKYIYTNDLLLTAKWNINTYRITYVLEEGIENKNPTSFDIEDEEIILKDPTRAGYTFNGWFDEENNKVTSIKPSEWLKDIVLTAKWNAKKHELTVLNPDHQFGEVDITGEGYTGENIVVKATPNTNCIFGGWFIDNKMVSDEQEYTFTMENKDVTLTVKFYSLDDIIDKIQKGVLPYINKIDKTLSYGYYPQTIVSNNAIIAELNNITSPSENGYYLLDNQYYASIEATPYQSNYLFSNGGEIEEGEKYWFKVEPITWNILKNEQNEYFLSSSSILDAGRYDIATEPKTIGGHTISPNNYEHSDIRKWLNEGFMAGAFLDGSLLVDMNIDNSASSTNAKNNPYVSNNTVDKISLLSYQESVNEQYFTDNDSRASYVTDYAKARGVLLDMSSDKYNLAAYWLRSPSHNSDVKSLVVSRTGSSSGVTMRTNSEYIGVKPIITIQIDEEFYHMYHQYL